jgi:CHAD domain-containing protein
MTNRTSSALGLALASHMAAQARVAMRALNQAQDRHRAVHEARKAIRRIRSGLALAGKTVGTQLAPIDTELRRLAKGLSRLRDAHVIVAAAKQLGQADPTEIWAEVSLLLELRRDRLLAEALEKDGGFQKRQDRLRKVAANIADLPWHSVTKHDVRDAIDRSARRADRAKQGFESSPAPAMLHRWRRRVRRIRLQSETIKKLEAGGSLAHADHHKLAKHSLGKLADSLGHKQDLQVLSSTLKEVVDPALATKLRAEIRREIGSKPRINFTIPEYRASPGTPISPL